MAMDKKFLNVILIGLAFLFVFTAFQTMGNIQKTLLDSIGKDNPDFKGDGYISMAVIYAVMSICNWTAPSTISMVGPKIAMIFGAITYLLYILSFLIPETWLLYVASTVIGVGAAMIWTGQGNYLTLNSSPATISRNSGIFWAMLQASLFIGNLFVYFQFEGKSHIDKDTRTITIWVLSAIAAAGIVVMVLLPRPPRASDESSSGASSSAPLPPPEGPLEALKGAWNLFMTKRMILLCITFFYTGIELSFFSGVYSSAVGFTKQFGKDSKQLVGMSGIFIGLGEVLGGALFGILGDKTRRWGRDPIVMAGFVIHVIGFFLIFLNLPNAAPFEDTYDEAFITSSAPLAIFCSFLLGFGDACFNTQIYSTLGGVYKDHSASAFAIFKFTQSVAAAACFFYASYVGLYAQLGILLVLAVLGTITYVLVEWEVKRQQNLDTAETQSNVSENSIHDETGKH